MANSSSGESMLERIVRVLESFDGDTPSLSVAELARRTGLPSSTTYRLVDELVASGLLDRVGREVQVGLRLWELTTRSSSALALREAARPQLDDLRRVLRAHALLGVLDRHDVLYVDRALARSSAVNLATVAGRLPAHASSAGLVLMAHQSAAVQEAWLGSRFTRYTPQTPTDPAQLRRVLAQVRQQGHAEAAGLLVGPSTGVAVPVESPDGRVIAALGIVVPVGETDAARTVPVLQAAARGITERLRAG